MTANGKAKFCLGPHIVATPGAIEAMEASGQDAGFFLRRHAAGDWGEVDAEDWQANEQALIDGSRILSVFRTLKGTRLYVITEAKDGGGHRAATTIWVFSKACGWLFPIFSDFGEHAREHLEPEVLLVP